MRAVNLVPKEYRRGPLAGKGGETASYFALGGLAVVLIAVLALVLTNNSISGKRSDIADLKQKEADARSRADALQSYASFASLQQTRTSTVSSLAQSRFDWERVIRELSDVMPLDIYLTNLTGTVMPNVQVENSASLPSRSSVSGPAVEIQGCTPTQVNVAKLIAALQDIDGVSRVGIQSSEASASESGGDSSSGAICKRHKDWPQFGIVAAFDAAPVPPDASGSPTLPAPAPTTEQAEVQSAKDRANKATDLVPGG